MSHWEKYEPLHPETEGLIFQRNKEDSVYFFPYEHLEWNPTSGLFRGQGYAKGFIYHKDKWQGYRSHQNLSLPEIFHPSSARTFFESRTLDWVNETKEQLLARLKEEEQAEAARQAQARQEEKERQRNRHQNRHLPMPAGEPTADPATLPRPAGFWQQIWG